MKQKKTKKAMLGFEQIPTPEKNSKSHPFLDDRLFHHKPEEESESPEVPETKFKRSFTFTLDAQETIPAKEAAQKISSPRGVPMQFGEDIILKQSIEAHKKAAQHIEGEKTKRRLVELFQSGNLEEIMAFILDESENVIFEQEMQRVKNEYREDLSYATFLMEKDWRILTALELFDKGTFKHSIHTYSIARKVLGNGPAKLRREIEQEGTILEQFYITCLFHDLGKFAIPKFILNSTVTDEVWNDIFLTQLSSEEQDEIFASHNPPLIVPDRIRKNHAQLHKFFKDNDFRAVTVVPIRKAFNKPEELAAFEERGIDSNWPLLKIMGPHANNSRIMLKKLGYGLEAILAGHHHSNSSPHEQESENPTSTSALQVFDELSADTIQTFDVFEALSGDRSYTSDSSWTKKYHVVIHLAEIGKIKNKWIPASIINTILKNSQEDFTNMDANGLEEIRRFLEENLPEEETSCFE